jgi:adenylate cyclase
VPDEIGALIAALREGIAALAFDDAVRSGLLETLQRIDKAAQKTAFGFDRARREKHVQFHLLSKTSADLRQALAATEQKVVERTRELSEEREKSERLLLNILPPAIADRLKASEATIADAHPEVTVLFADIVNFTGISSRCTPSEMVAMLNDVFSAFDALAAEHDLEKIKTIGDAYMVVGGVPRPRSDHAEAVAAMALDMLRAVVGKRAPTGEPVRVRVGINSGPVVAGVIGTAKFAYDLWGDVVNTASRMESHGLAEAIQVSETTYERLKGKYEFAPRGEVEIKGKGAMLTYLLLGQRLPKGDSRE